MSGWLWGPFERMKGSHILLSMKRLVSGFAGYSGIDAQSGEFGTAGRSGRAAGEQYCG